MEVTAILLYCPIDWKSLQPSFVIELEIDKSQLLQSSNTPKVQYSEGVQHISEQSRR